jgi:hypothetical protein
MRIVASLALLGLMILDGFIAYYGFAISWWCFAQGPSLDAWVCFWGFNTVFSGPAIIAIVAGCIQFFRKRLRSALIIVIIAAIPAALAVIAYFGFVF